MRASIIAIFILFTARFNAYCQGHEYYNLRTGKLLTENGYLKDVKQADYESLISILRDKNAKLRYNYLVTYGIKGMIDEEKKLDSLTIGKRLIFKDTDFLDIKDYPGYNKSKPTFLSLWFIQCKGCIQEIPHLNRLKFLYGDKVNFLSLTFENKEDVTKFISSHDFKLTALTNEDLTTSLGRFSYPRIFLLNENQEIVWSCGGVLETEVEGYEVIFDHLLSGNSFERRYIHINK